MQKLFKDERDGATTKRPALVHCPKALQEGDTLTVESSTSYGTSVMLTAR
jgi:hypothetical protein